MITRTFTYEGFDGKMYTDTWYFHLNEAESFKIRARNIEGMDGMLRTLSRTNDGGEIMDLIDAIILNSVGKRSIDGRQFIKNAELRDEFRQTDAYSQLFMELISDADKAAEFMIGIMPAKLAAEARKNIAEATDQNVIQMPAN